MRRRDGNGGFGRLFSVKLELDFHAGGGRSAVIRSEPNNLSMKKSSIGGKRYLDYLCESIETIIYNYWWCWRFCEPVSEVVCPW